MKIFSSHRELLGLVWPNLPQSWAWWARNCSAEKIHSIVCQFSLADIIRLFKDWPSRSSRAEVYFYFFYCVESQGHDDFRSPTHRDPCEDETGFAHSTTLLDIFLRFLFFFWKVFGAFREDENKVQIGFVALVCALFCSGSLAVHQLALTAWC